MTTALLETAPAGRHICQIHKDPAALASSVSRFVASGLKRGERVVVVAVPDHVRLILAKLEAAEWNADAFASTNQLTILDAAALLERFMKNGMPEWNDFQRTVGTLISRRSGASYPGVRVYGEMVNLLWHEGNHQAAVRLEEYWNELARHQSFCLMCCYLIDALNPEHHHGPLPDIGRTHSDMVLTEHNRRVQAAVDQASREILGSTLSVTLSLSGHEEHAGEHRLPAGMRSMIWLKKNMPGIYPRVLERAREHYSAMAPSAS